MPWTAEQEARYQELLRNNPNLQSADTIPQQGQATQEQRMASDKPLEADPWYNPVDLIAGGAGEIPSAIRGATALAGAGAEAASQLPGRAARSAADFVIGKTRGLSPKEITTFADNPAAVKSLMGIPELEAQSRAKTALGTANDALSSRGSSLEALLQGQIRDKSVPASDTAAMGQYAPKMTLDDLLKGNSQVPLSSVVSAGRKAANEGTSWILDPVTGGLKQATNPEAGQAYGAYKQMLGNASPEASQTVQDMKAGIDAQKNIRGAMNSGNALGFMGREGDTAANRQGIDQLTGDSGLDQFAKQYQTAKQLENPSGHGAFDKFVGQPIGRATLEAMPYAAKANTALTGAGETVDAVLNNALSQKAIQEGTVKQGADKLQDFLNPKPPVQWTPEQEQRFQQLSKQFQGI